MYISLSIVMIVGLALLLLPTSIIQKANQKKWICVCRRIAGAILILVSVIIIYAIISDAIVLPLFK